jgi:hypothetical protein
MRRTLPFVPVAVALLIAGLSAQQPAPKAVASIKEIHEAMISPSSDAIFDVGREAPKTDAGWTALRQNAIILAEAGNLLMVDGRAKDKGNWMKMARALVDTSAVALKAVQARHADDVVKAGDQIVSVCEDCHEPYRDHGRKMLR